MKTEELVAVIDRGAPAGTAAVTLHLGSSEYADRALEALFDVLGDDPSPSDVDVVIDGDRVGMLRKEVLFALVQNGIMKMGDTSLSALLGDPAPAYVVLRCPAQTCERRVIIAPDLYGKPVVCPVHHQAMVS